MSAPRVLEVSIDVSSESVAEHVARALAPETKSTPAGTSVQIESKGPRLLLRFEAADARGLRAAANSFLRLVDASIAVARQAQP